VQVLCNGRLVLAGTLREPARGAWTARLELDAEDGDLDGVVDLAIGDARWSGWAVGDVEGGRTIVRVVGGQDGLRERLHARYYFRTTVRQVVEDILRETGEKLDPDSDRVVLAMALGRWARAGLEAQSSLTAVLKQAGASYRVTRRGLVLVFKADTFPTVSMKYVLTSRDPALGTMEITPEDSPLARPGVAVDQHRVVEVLTEIESGTVTQTLTLEDKSGRTRGAAAQFLEATRRTVEGPLLFSQWYPAKVVKQESDGTVELYPDHEGIRGNGITKVPIRHGLPGVTVKVKLGERVILFFEEGDPLKPACALWPDGSSVLEVVLSADTRITLKSDTCLGAAEATHQQVLGDILKTLLEQLTVPTALGPSGTPINAPAFAQFLSQRHKLDR